MLADAAGPWPARVPRYARYFEGLEMDVDVFPLTREEWGCRLEAGDPFCRGIAESQLCLAERVLGDH